MITGQPSPPPTPPLRRRVGGSLAASRLEAFSDGVFAVAITLLVVNLQVPPSISGHGDLVADLLSEWPAYLSLIVSFATVGIIWVNHHAVFTLVARVDRVLLLLNLLLLLAVVILPFPTQLLGRALQAGHNQAIVAALYSACSLFMGLAFGAVFFYATSSPRLRHHDLPAGYVRRLSPLFTIGTVVYAAAILVAFVSPVASLLMNGAMAVYYAILRTELGEDPSLPETV